MKTQSLQPDVAALGNVVDALNELDEQQKVWVLQAAASRFALRIQTSVPGGGLPFAGGSITPPALGSNQIQGDAEVSPKTFIRSKDPKSDVQRISCLAYYLTKFRNTPHFKTRELTELNTEAACPKLSNPTVAVNNARKAKYLTPAGKGNKQLTTGGEDLVDALPDQEKVKGLMLRSCGRKKRSRKKR